MSLRPNGLPAAVVPALATLTLAGAVVVAGQLLGRCGTSGTTLPHLHFGVFEALVYDQAQSLAVSFRNAEGPLDSRGGLAEGTTYTALACR